MVTGSPPVATPVDASCAGCVRAARLSSRPRVTRRWCGLLGARTRRRSGRRGAERCHGGGDRFAAVATGRRRCREARCGLPRLARAPRSSSRDAGPAARVPRYRSGGVLLAVDARAGDVSQELARTGWTRLVRVLLRTRTVSRFRSRAGEGPKPRAGADEGATRAGDGSFWTAGPPSPGSVLRVVAADG
jgi:hypothetical protein